ncbi:hypothetical protein SAMN06269250_5919 [Spirosoma fluviale]|uniref:Uncharacterized protein n=1 Tax=Spirosoma fluviale TaxID=1597977 RepID=A0A286GQE6_9BACT|nr:hypothetical protein SAMN06269250_5919 [Spirosoma fluviale]
MRAYGIIKLGNTRLNTALDNAKIKDIRLKNLNALTSRSTKGNHSTLTKPSRTRQIVIIYLLRKRVLFELPLLWFA